MMRTHRHIEGNHTLGAPSRWTVEGGRGSEKITDGYEAQYLGDETICTTNLHDTSLPM